MDDLRELWYFHTEQQTWENFNGRRNAIIKALTDDVEEFYKKFDDVCIPVSHLAENQYLGLYGYPNGKWQVNLSGDMPSDLPLSRLDELPKQEKDRDAWLAKVAADIDVWLLSLTFSLCGHYSYYPAWREWLFKKINELPTIYEAVTINYKNQEVAAENAKKRVKDKSEVQGMSSSSLVKDLKREGKKAITKRELPMRSAMQTRSKALGIQTRAQTRKSQIKKIS